MILEIDAGNTRAKWRLLAPHETEAQALAAAAIFLHGDPHDDALNLTRSIAEFWSGRIDIVRVSNVRGEAFQSQLRDVMTNEWGVLPEFPTPVRECAGVVNGYTEPEKLGVDRWLAILAAYSAAGGRCCIVDCGTTITVDLVTDAGRHLGGYIVPGLIMMKTMLTRQSSVLKWETPSAPDIVPGHNTAEAINHGALAMIAAFIDRVLARVAGDEKSPPLYLTGGDGLLVQQFLDHRGLYKPELVLDGLQLACVKPRG